MQLDSSELIRNKLYDGRSPSWKSKNSHQNINSVFLYFNIYSLLRNYLEFQTEYEAISEMEYKLCFFLIWNLPLNMVLID